MPYGKKSPAKMGHKSPAKMGHKSPVKKESAKQERKNLLTENPVDNKASAMRMGHSPVKMGHKSPAEMGHSPMQNHHYGKRKASAVKMGHESPAKMGHESPMKMAGSWMTKHSKSALHMGHKSPAEMGHSPLEGHCMGKENKQIRTV